MRGAAVSYRPCPGRELRQFPLQAIKVQHDEFHLVVILAGLLSIVYGVVTSSKLLAADAGSPRMQEIAGAIAEGAQAYLKRQYPTIALVGMVIFAAFGFLVSWLLAFGFLLGAILSGAAGFIGMNVSVRANVRTAQAAMQSLAAGLDISFKAGAVTGLWSPAWRCSASPAIFIF